MKYCLIIALMFSLFVKSFSKDYNYVSDDSLLILKKNYIICKSDSIKLNIAFNLHFYQQKLIGELNESNVFTFDLQYTKEGIKLAEKLFKYDTLKILTVDLGYIFDLSKSFDSSFVYYSNSLNIFKAANRNDLAFTISENVLYNNSLLQTTIEETSKMAKLQQHKISRLISIILSALVLFTLLLIIFFYRTKKDNKQLLIQKNKVLKSKIEIESSINYAQNIQQAILSNEEKLSHYFPYSFVLFMPRDKVSGDFLWTRKINEDVYFAVADCTGHGVPGALLSIVGHFLLDSLALNNFCGTPSKALDSLHLELVKSLNQHNNSNNHDGMDIAFCKYNTITKKLMFASANRSLIIVRNNEIIEYKGDKRPTGGIQIKYETKFTNLEIDLFEEDFIYCYTDGYADQFGGTKNKRLLNSNLKKNILANATKSVKDQMLCLKNDFDTYKADNEQTDDVLIVGIKIL